MPAEPRPIAPTEARAPRGLEGIGQAELRAHLETGTQKANDLSRVAKSSDNVQKQLGELITTAATKVEQTKVHPIGKFSEVHVQRVIKDKEISDAKKAKRELGKKERRLKKTVNRVERVKADKVDLLPEAVGDFEAEAVKLEKTVKTSLEQTNKAKIEADQKETKARGEKKALGYSKALAEEISKVPDNISARWNKGKLNGAMRVAEEAAESIPLYYAGQEVLTQRIQEQVKPDHPIEDSFYESAKALDKAVKATRKEELRLARKIDKAVKDPEIKKANRLTAEVRGEHVAEDLAILSEAKQAIAEIQGGGVGGAVEVAANRVRLLIEKPGFGKKALKDSLLTTQALNEAIKGKDIVDPVRKLVYNSMSGRQKSVEEALGCEISVKRDGKERLVEIKIPEDSEEQTQDRTTNLFTSLVNVEFQENGLRDRLNKVEPGNIREVRTLSKALEMVGKERAALIKLANARINGVFTAEGVRSGDIKTRLADTAVKGTEAGIVTGIAAGATYLGVNHHMEAAQSVVAKANTLIAPLKEVLQNGPDLIKGLMEGLKGVSLPDIQTAINSGSTSELFKNAKPFIDAFNKVQSVSSQLNLAPEQINAITQGALRSTAAEQTGAMRDLIIGSGATAVTALSFTEGIRKIAGAPGRGVRSLYRHFFG